MDTAIEKAINTAIAVPGALGIVLAIATFAFMAWLVYFVMTTNAKREERGSVREDKLMEFIQVQMAQQQASLGRIELAGTYQRDEHKKIMDQGDKCLERHDKSVLVLERLFGMLTANGGSKKPA